MGRRGYFANAGSRAESAQSQNSDPRAETTRRALAQAAQRPGSRDSPRAPVCGGGMASAR
jgi:hypothetical protein